MYRREVADAGPNQRGCQRSSLGLAIQDAAPAAADAATYMTSLNYATPALTYASRLFGCGTSVPLDHVYNLFVESNRTTTPRNRPVLITRRISSNMLFKSVFFAYFANRKIIIAFYE